MNFIYDKNRIYVEDASGKMIVEATFPSYNDTTVVIDHTFVDPSLRGQGIASKLMFETCKYIKEQGLKVVATCPYAVVWFKRHHDFDDIINLEEQAKLAPECRI